CTLRCGRSNPHEQTKTTLHRRFLVHDYRSVQQYFRPHRSRGNRGPEPDGSVSKTHSTRGEHEYRGSSRETDPRRWSKRYGCGRSVLEFPHRRDPAAARPSPAVTRLAP